MPKGSTHNMARLDAATQKKLATGIRKIEGLEEERAEIGEDISAVKKDLKAAGINTKAVNRILSDNKARRRDAEKHEDFTTALDVYMVALGLV